MARKTLKKSLDTPVFLNAWKIQAPQVSQQASETCPLDCWEKLERLRVRKELADLLEYCGELCSIVHNYEKTYKELKWENDTLKREIEHLRREEEQLRVRCHCLGNYPFKH